MLIEALLAVGMMLLLWMVMAVVSMETVMVWNELSRGDGGCGGRRSGRIGGRMETGNFSSGLLLRKSLN